MTYKSRRIAISSKTQKWCKSGAVLPFISANPLKHSVMGIYLVDSFPSISIRPSDWFCNKAVATRRYLFDDISQPFRLDRD